MPLVTFGFIHEVLIHILPERTNPDQLVTLKNDVATTQLPSKMLEVELFLWQFKIV